MLPRARKNHIQIFLYSSPKSLPTNDIARTVNITKWKNKTKQVKQKKRDTTTTVRKEKQKCQILKLSHNNHCEKRETEVPNIKTVTQQPL